MVLPAVYVELESQPRPSFVEPILGDSAVYVIFVADWGYHTSIIIQQPPGRRLGPENYPSAPFVEFAWGERHLFMDGSHGAWSAVTAALYPSRSVVYVQGWAAPPDPKAWGGAKLFSRRILGPELRALAAELDGSFDRTSMYPATSRYIGRFYASSAHYLWWHDCNFWTVERLNHAGLARTARGVILAGQVASRLVDFDPQ